jgi:hypothetical protein
MSNRPSVRWLCAAPLAALLIAQGCSKSEVAVSRDRDDELAWARKALERNPQLEVVATDTDARTFTVRHRSSGDVQVVALDKLAAVPIASLTAAPASAPESPRLEPALPQPVADSESPAVPPADESPATEPASAQTQYTIRREGGQVRVTGPGVSIVSASSATPSPDTPTAQNMSETPIICDGGRFLHLDRRNLRVNGTAVIARNGCELHITNSTIEATDVAISVQDATVHIANSQVAGQNSSVAATGRARLYVRSSTFRGIARRNDPAEINDQGGNTWR